MRNLEEKIEIRSSKQEAWEVLADFGGAAAWAPGMRTSSVRGELKTGVGAYRVMRHSWGFTVEESVTRWTEGIGYAFDLVRAPFPMSNVRESLSLEYSQGRTVVSTSVSYDMRLGVLGALLDTILVRFLVRREMQAGMRGLKKFVELKAIGNASSAPTGSA